jgi:hypothetical protein
MAILPKARKMTKQQIFDHVAEHLLTQGVQSIAIEAEEEGEEPMCLYRAGDLACAVGCLIPDSLYVPEMEGKNVVSLLLNFSGFKYLQPHEKLLFALQSIHDNERSYLWSKALKEIAEVYKLNPPA